MGAIELSKNADNWKICYDRTKISIDYADYLSLIRQKKGLNKARVQQLIRIVENGPLLSEVQYEWLDHFRSVTGSEIIEALTDYVKTIPHEESPEHRVEVANVMSVFNPVNEEAMHLQCTALSRMGKDRKSTRLTSRH